MNPGYLSLLLISITFILLASGWKEELVRGIPHKVILLFFIGWFALGRFDFLVKGKYEVHAVYFLLLIVSAIIVVRAKPLQQKAHLLSAAMFLGSFHFMILQLYLLDPALIMYHPLFDATISFSLLAMIVIRDPVNQISGVTIGLMLGDFLYRDLNHGLVPLQLGGPLFQDKWWLTVLLTRMLSEGFVFLLKGCRSIIHLWHDRRKD